MNKNLEKLNIKDRIDFLSRYIIIHSIIYYECNDSIITDKKYDETAKYLAKLIKENPKEFKECYYNYVMYDFTGETGFYLKDRLTDKDRVYLEKLALYVIHIFGNENNSSSNKKQVKKIKK